MGKGYIVSDDARYYYNAELQTWLDKRTGIVQIYSPNLNSIGCLGNFSEKRSSTPSTIPNSKRFKERSADCSIISNNAKVNSNLL